jgi:aspartate/methionine/tyrosine aminotransferase
MLSDFQLKTFFSNDVAKAAKGTISPSYADLLTVDELLAYEPEAKTGYLHQILGYTRPNGSEQLRVAIADYLNQQNKSSKGATPLQAGQITVTAGSDEAIFMVMDAWLSEEPGAHVIVHTPIYQSLLNLPEKYGATVSQWPAEEADGWRPSLDKLSTLLRPNTRMIVVNFPHNPTGWHPEPEYRRALLDLVERTGIVLVADEVYAGLRLHPETTFECLAGLSAQVVALGSMSKAFAMPGVRVGWIATQNMALLARLARLHQYINTYPAQPSEFLTQLALRHAEQILARNCAIAQANFARLEALLDELPHLIAWQKPVAGVVCYPRWLAGDSSAALSHAFFQATGWLLAPSARFLDGDHHFRIGYGTRTFDTWFPLLQEFLLQQQ